MRQLSDFSKKKMLGVHPTLVRLMEMAIKECPLQFEVSHGVRPDAEQAELYARGRTKPGKIVTMCDGVIRRSKHQALPGKYGEAVDIVVYVDGQVTWDPKHYKTVAKHILKVAKGVGGKVRWGGDWNGDMIDNQKFYDYPHYEVI